MGALDVRDFLERDLFFQPSPISQSAESRKDMSRAKSPRRLHLAAYLQNRSPALFIQKEIRFKTASSRNPKLLGCREINNLFRLIIAPFFRKQDGAVFNADSPKSRITTRNWMKGFVNPPIVLSEEKKSATRNHLVKKGENALASTRCKQCEQKAGVRKAWNIVCSFSLVLF